MREWLLLFFNPVHLHFYETSEDKGCTNSSMLEVCVLSIIERYKLHCRKLSAGTVAMIQTQQWHFDDLAQAEAPIHHSFPTRNESNSIDLSQSFPTYSLGQSNCCFTFLSPFCTSWTVEDFSVFTIADQLSYVKWPFAKHVCVHVYRPSRPGQSWKRGIES